MEEEVINVAQTRVCAMQTGTLKSDHLAELPTFLPTMRKPALKSFLLHNSSHWNFRIKVYSVIKMFRISHFKW